MHLLNAVIRSEQKREREGEDGGLWGNIYSIDLLQEKVSRRFFAPRTRRITREIRRGVQILRDHSPTVTSTLIAGEQRLG